MDKGLTVVGHICAGTGYHAAEAALIILREKHPEAQIVVLSDAVEINEQMIRQVRTRLRSFKLEPIQLATAKYGRSKSDDQPWKKPWKR